MYDEDDAFAEAWQDSSEPVTLELHSPGQATYRAMLDAAFPFFRRFSAGRYSAASIMRLARAADDATNGVEDALPNIIVFGTPFAYDEDTECKKGGNLAMAVHWPSAEGRTMIAVLPQKREKHLGTLMLTCLLRCVPRDEVHTWVGQTNLAGHRLALSAGLIPTAISPQGAVRYATAAMLEEAGDGSEAVESVMARPTDSLSRAARRAAQRGTTIYTDGALRQDGWGELLLRPVSPQVRRAVDPPIWQDLSEPTEVTDDDGERW